ncbi:helix-turn-helix transcriptional regulator [Rhizobium sp. SL42]|uniref:helix-turn-helix transcriptional regulator n=1 Tax=Rhizobium sp. SL42 TaxID=2806346 RepID=UPI001F42FBEC|nr:helix-turn-helix transcriptional regulator [Rhizobium sp. SL42]UJW77584.1 helix-turn-helix transcriptional regulator [Rhizobium sp. SL42]
MTQVIDVALDRRPLSAGEISDWLLKNKDLDHYRPISSDRVGSYSFTMRAVDGFAAWDASSAASRQFDVGLNGDNFMFFLEKNTSYTIRSGAISHGLCRDSGLITSADRYSGIDISELSAGEGFVVSRTAITKALFDIYQRPIVGDFEFSPTLDLRSQNIKHIVGLMRYFRDNVLGAPDLNVSPLAVVSFQEMLSFLMVGNLEHSCSNFVPLSSRIAPIQVKRAREILHANAHLPIAIADVAEAVGVSVRALQVNFRTFLDTTPRLYLHLLRLDGVRRDLQHASPASITIADVARRWGFTHMGRFAREYRKKFGVKPSEDLGRIFLV